MGYKAVVLAIGAQRSRKLGIPARSLGVMHATDFLRAVAMGNPPPDRQGGRGGRATPPSTPRAPPCARCQRRVVYRRTRAEMPAQDMEVTEAAEEGV